MKTARIDMNVEPALKKKAVKKAKEQDLTLTQYIAKLIRKDTAK